MDGVEARRRAGCAQGRPPGVGRAVVGQGYRAGTATQRFEARRLLDRLEHELVAHAVLEVGPHALAGGHRVQEVVDGVGEGVLVADDVARRPPRCP